MSQACTYDPPECSCRLHFTSSTAGSCLPLPGASFVLSNGQTAVSDAGGHVDFGVLAAGAYTLTETASPQGYAPECSNYHVCVSDHGSLAVNGLPLADFHTLHYRLRSEPPSLYPVIEETLFLSGTGVPGGAILILLPDGILLVANVDTDGQWITPVPSSTVLLPHQIIYANQTRPGYDTSSSTPAVVVPHLKWL